MARVITMPKFGLSMETGTVTAWLKKLGDRVEKGEPLVEIETDKITAEFESPESGHLLKIIVEEGSQAEVKEPICVIGEKGETVDSIQAGAAPDIPPPEATASPADTWSSVGAAAARPVISPLARKLAAESGIDPAALKGTGPGGRIVKEDVEAAMVSRKSSAESAVSRKAERIPISPRARKLMAERGLDSSQFQSLKRERITESDVLEYLNQQSSAPPSSPVPAPTEEKRELSGMRKRIAERMSLSKRTIPHFYLRVAVDGSAMIRMRQSLPFKPTYNDMIIKACAAAMAEFPEVNVSFVDNVVLKHADCNIGLAASLARGLIVPVVRSAQAKSLKEIAAVTADFILQARADKLTLDDVTGGTFTVTSLGTHPIDEFSAIINPPESAIIAVGRILDQPVVVDKQVVVRPTVKLTLSVDHRIIDGMLAAQFLSRIKELLEAGHLLEA